mmetsp:Transcript_78349/g.122240  ORF Transcript_78349/g.122240 Transcript_78349/m.122240 type:complete len:1021 (-) Transcript_78349:64-3126(-)
MSSDGDISVAEALQQLKKRARNEDQPKAAVRPAIPWPEPPLPKIRKEENSGAQLPPRMQQFNSRPPMQQAQMGAAGGGPGAGLRPPAAGLGGQRPIGPAFGPLAGAAPQIGPTLGPAMPPGFALGGPRMSLLQNKLTAPAVPFGPAVPPDSGETKPGTDIQGPQVGPMLSGPPAAALAAPTKTTVTFEVPQSKVGLLIGKQASTINAIKVYSKANCHVEQQTPDEEKARVTIVGLPDEVEKCKQTITALLNGMMNTAMIFQLAGLPPPDSANLGATAAPALAATAPMSAPPGLSGPIPAALQTALPKPALPPMPTPMSAGLSQAPMGLPPGLPMQGMAPTNDTQIQEKLNDYYAQWWSQYAIAQQPGVAAAGAEGVDASKPAAFDREALARLAEQASKEEDEPAPAPAPEAPPVAPTPSAPLPPLTGSLTERATQEVQHLLEGIMSGSGVSPPPPAPTAPPQQISQLGAPSNELPQPASIPPPPGAAPAVAPAPGSLSGMLNGGFQIRPQTPAAPRANRDNDSVMKMLQTMQGNVIQAKIENIESKQAANQAMAKPRGPAEALPGFEPAFAPQEIRHVDPQLEALFGRLDTISSPQALDAANKEVLERLPVLNPEQVGELLQKLEIVTGFSHGELIGDVGRALAPRLREFTATQFTSLMSSFMTWLSGETGAGAMEKSRPFMMSASTEMSSRLMEFAPHEINCCLAALIASSFSELRFFAQVGRAALARHSSFGPIQLTALLSLLSEVRLCHLDLFNAAAQYTVVRTKELRKVDLLRFVRSFGKCNIRCDPLCQAFGNEVVLRLKRGDSFKTEELCEVMWIFCCLQSYHEELFRMTLKQLEETPQVATDALCWLYECHLVLDSEHKEAYASYRIDSDGINALLQNYKDNRKDVRRCSGKLRNDVANVLKSLVEGSVSANHRTSTGLLVDVAALRKRTSTDGFIHVEIDSAMSVIRALDQEDSSPTSLLIEGPVALRRRILEKHGLIIVTLRESEWHKLDDSREKRRHLRSQLSALSDVLE